MRKISMACLTRLLRIVLFLAIALQADPEGHIRLATAQTTLSPQQIRALLDESAKRFARTEMILIDPQIIDHLLASTLNFTGNFCISPQGDRCPRTLQDQAFRDRTVHSYIGELAKSLPRSIRNIADRFAEGDLGKTGWPAEANVSVALIEIPRVLQSAQFYIRRASAAIPLGTNARYILLNSGKHELEWQNGSDRQTYSFDAAASQRLNLPLTGQAASGVTQGPINPAMSFFCFGKNPLKREGALAVFNWGRGQYGESALEREKFRAPFTRQASLKVSVEADAGVQCDNQCRKDLGVIFAESIAIWRSGCPRCSPNAASVLAVDQSVWVDWRIVYRIQNQLALDLEVFAQGEREQLVSSPSWDIGGVIAPYVEVSSDVNFKGKLCRLPDGAAPWLKNAQGFLCGARPDVFETVLEPRLVLMKKATACGPDAVACGLPMGRVEVNLRNYRFSIPNNRDKRDWVLGDSGQLLKMSQVILHEVGHWYGVPHSEVGGSEAFQDIMSKDYGGGEPCVSGSSLVMLNNAADLRWRYRIQSGGALGPPARSNVPVGR